MTRGWTQKQEMILKAHYENPDLSMGQIRLKLGCRKSAKSIERMANKLGLYRSKRWPPWTAQEKTILKNFARNNRHLTYREMVPHLQRNIENRTPKAIHGRLLRMAAKSTKPDLKYRRERLCRCVEEILSANPPKTIFRSENSHSKRFFSKHLQGMNDLDKIVYGLTHLGCSAKQVEYYVSEFLGTEIWEDKITRIRSRLGCTIEEMGTVSSKIDRIKQMKESGVYDSDIAEFYGCEERWIRKLIKRDRLKNKVTYNG